VLSGVHGRLCAVADVQLAEDVFDVGQYRLLGEMQLLWQ